ncbi:hypothetical protein [Streptomyces sp. NPDC048473]|uniref:hypothetical protein n=1 Tax=unclassified Streptomyces TaxID=2593676 RepID=UPI00371CFDBF
MAAPTAGIRADQGRQGLACAALRFSDDTVPALSGGGGTSMVERFAITLDRRDPWTGWERIDFCGVEEGRPLKDRADFFPAVRDFNAAHPRVRCRRSGVAGGASLRISAWRGRCAG